MPVLTPADAWSRTATLPVPLEPDIEHLRRRHGNTTLCLALIAQLQQPPLPSSLLTLSHLNCSLPDLSDADDVTQLVLDIDPVYYVLPVVLIAGIVCDTLSALLLGRLLLLRTPSRNNDDVTSYAYLFWFTVTCNLWLACATARAVPDYTTWSVAESLRWTEGYLTAVGEWLSFASLWILLTTSLNCALQLSASNNSSPVRTADYRVNTETTSNHTHHHHHHHQQQQQQQQPPHQRRCCRATYVCFAIHIICVVSSLPQFFAVQFDDRASVAANKTVIVSRLDERLTTSFEYSVVYYWYVVCLTVILPVPLLTVLVVVLAASLVRKSRRSRHHKKVPVKPPSAAVQAPSVSVYT